MARFNPANERNTTTPLPLPPGAPYKAIIRLNVDGCPPPCAAVSERISRISKKNRRHGAAGQCLSYVQDQFGSVADFGFGGNAALVLVPRRRSSALLSALSSLASGGM